MSHIYLESHLNVQDELESPFSHRPASRDQLQHLPSYLSANHSQLRGSGLHLFLCCYDTQCISMKTQKGASPEQWYCLLRNKKAINKLNENANDYYSKYVINQLLNKTFKNDIMKKNFIYTYAKIIFPCIFHMFIYKL